MTGLGLGIHISTASWPSGANSDGAQTPEAAGGGVIGLTSPVLTRRAKHKTRPPSTPGPAYIVGGQRDKGINMMTDPMASCSPGITNEQSFEADHGTSGGVLMQNRRTLSYVVIFNSTTTAVVPGRTIVCVSEGVQPTSQRHHVIPV